MSMSTFVVGFKPPDEKWKNMREAWLACRAAGIEVPDAVSNFFGGEPPDGAGVEVGQKVLSACGAISAWSADGRDGFELHVKNLPADVTIIRFYNHW